MVRWRGRRRSPRSLLLTHPEGADPRVSAPPVEGIPLHATPVAVDFGGWRPSNPPLSLGSGCKTVKYLNAGVS